MRAGAACPVLAVALACAPPRSGSPSTSPLTSSAVAARCHSPATGALLEVRRSSSQGLESRVHVDAGGAWSHERFDPRVSTAPTAVTHGCLSPDSATRLETALAKATWRAFPLDHACAEVFHLVTQYVVHGAVRWATDACRLRLDVTSAHALAVIDDELRSVVQR